MSESDVNEPDEGDQVPDGAAIFPEIPAELGIHPLLLATIHSVVFLAGSEADIVRPEAADEAVVQIAEYLQRLEGESLRRVQEDLVCLTTFARQQGWPRPLVQSLKSFLADLGVEPEQGES